MTSASPPIEPEEQDDDVRAELQQILDSIRTDPIGAQHKQGLWGADWA